MSELIKRIIINLRHFLILGNDTQFQVYREARSCLISKNNVHLKTVFSLSFTLPLIMRPKQLTIEQKLVINLSQMLTIPKIESCLWFYKNFQYI